MSLYLHYFSNLWGKKLEKTCNIANDNILTIRQYFLIFEIVMKIFNWFVFSLNGLFELVKTMNSK